MVHGFPGYAGFTIPSQSLKEHSQENICEIIALNYSLSLN
jgi:hypothetical protein